MKITSRHFVVVFFSNPKMNHLQKCLDFFTVALQMEEMYPVCVTTP